MSKTFIYTTFVYFITFGSINPAVAEDDVFFQKKHTHDCGNQYYGQTTPQYLSQNNFDIYYLCFDGFAVGYTGVGKVALWSAEHLTKQRLEQAQTLERKDSFHEESQLPNRVKATLNDYKKMPYDRGHLAPNGDMATPEQQYDSFSLANIVPQNPNHNRSLWRSLETRTRYLTLKYGDVYVVTGTAFWGKNIKKLNNKILVPTHLYKAIYIPSLNQAGVYFSPNNDSGLVEVISLDELAMRISVDVMPSVDPSVQKIAMPLPTENLDDTPKSKPKNQDNHTFWVFLINLALALLEWLASVLKN
ncbi:DNA/RNA non-specific endonuclease [Faucicola mancuniensis]|uniref:DNA/RNA non-specific endonuclease n=1 Tax=Faucicola mancuniensis TaxID=1309795 RepID=UPI003977ACFE